MVTIGLILRHVLVSCNAYCVINCQSINFILLLKTRCWTAGGCREMSTASLLQDTSSAKKYPGKYPLRFQ